MNPSSSPHLQIFNSIRNTNNEDRCFTNFQSLPKELRLKIWRHSMQRERIIKVSFENNPPIANTTDIDGKTVQHSAIVDGHKILSKLLRVSQEARYEALSFYRVHIPCTLRRGPTREERETAKPGTFYFNPEYDFLQIQPGFWAEQTLMDFLYHLKNTWDPRQIGLLNMAIGKCGALEATDLCFIKPSDVDVRLRKSFRQTLTQIQEIFLVEWVCTGRQILGAMSGVALNEFILNRSMPIDTSTPTFDRLHHDPRPIAEDLEHAYIGEGPLRMLYLWQKLLKTWDISPTGTKYQFLLTFVPPGSHPGVHDERSAKQWVEKEDYEWTGKWREDDNVDGVWARRKFSDGTIWKQPVGTLYGKYKDEDLEKAAKPAFGFWMFPVDVFGKVPTSDAESENIFTKQIVNISEHWLGLGLKSLS